MDRSSADSKRYAVVADTYLQFPGEQVPLKARVGNLSHSGMFLVSEITYPAGTDFNFRITAERPEDTITGRGRVAWRRQVAAGQHRPPGMGCQILRLTDDSREALRRRLDASTEMAIVREPPDTRSLTQEFSRQAVQDSLVTQQIQRPDYFQTASPSAAKRPTRLLPGVLAALALVVALGVGFWALRSGRLLELDGPEAPVEATDPGGIRPAIDDSESPEPASPAAGSVLAGDSDVNGATSASPKPPTATPPDLTPAAAGAPPTEKKTTGPSASQALETVRGWADAWADQNPGRYLSYYASTFSPGEGVSRSAWASERRRRLSEPRFIRLDLEDLQFVEEGERGVATFRQSYRSDTFSDVVDKRLTLEVIDGIWKIVAEQSTVIP